MKPVNEISNSFRKVQKRVPGEQRLFHLLNQIVVEQYQSFTLVGANQFLHQVMIQMLFKLELLHVECLVRKGYFYYKAVFAMPKKCS